MKISHDIVNPIIMLECLWQIFQKFHVKYIAAKPEVGPELYCGSRFTTQNKKVMSQQQIGLMVILN